MFKFFRHFLNGESKTITSAAMVLAATSLASRLIGMLRDRSLAGNFGVGEQLDIYFAAFRVPDFLYNLLILGALSAGFIPIFTAALAKADGREAAWRMANGVLHLLTGAVGILLVLGVIFAGKLVPLIVPDFSPEAMEKTVSLTRIMFLSPLFLGFSTVFGGILQSFKRFVIFSLGPIFYNLGIILGAEVFVRFWGLEGLAWGVVLGSFLHFAIQIPALVELGYRYQWVWAWREPFIREIMTLMIPRTLGLAVTQLNLVAMTVIAGGLAEGSISVFNLANNFQSFAVGIIGLSFAIAAFPAISEAVAREDRADLLRHASATIRQIFLFILPATVLFLLLRGQIVRVVLGTGSFDWDATRLTADTLAFFVISLAAQSLIPLLARIFYAYRDTVTPFVIGLVAVAMNIGFALWLREPLGVRGLALAFSASAVVQCLLLWIALRGRLQTLDELAVLRSLYKMAVATLGMAVTVQSLKVPLDWLLNTQTFVGIFLQGFLAGLSGLVVYVMIGILFRSEEIILLVTSLRKKFFREFMPKETADEATGP
ncbi:murein biosynthesis integral membrane protein MurJ [Candidatus Uhrbacteria bacterium]|nr:murein biosynthesis integral membrane protein MurJ [Candidatus Uhrbacteria bacterium]